MSNRSHALIDSKHREVRGFGGELRDAVRPLLLRASEGRKCYWKDMWRRAGPNVDQVEAENLLWAAVDAGLVVVRERRNRRGDWEPYQYVLTPAGEVYCTSTIVDETIDVATYLGCADDPRHPILASIRAWLKKGPQPPILTRIVMAIGDELRAGRLPLDRHLSLRITGKSKGLRVFEHRDALETALEVPLDKLVRTAGRMVLVAGALRYRLGDIQMDTRGIVPFIALPPETVIEMRDLQFVAKRLLTIENLVPFEATARAGIATDTLAMYLGGFPGELERELIGKLVTSGIQCIDHWGDSDLGGLRILRHVSTFSAVPTHPYRMHADVIRHLPGSPLTDNDRLGLKEWLADPDAPYSDIARGLLEGGRKVEQEAWFLGGNESIASGECHFGQDFGRVFVSGGA